VEQRLVQTGSVLDRLSINCQLNDRFEDRDSVKAETQQVRIADAEAGRKAKKRTSR